MSATAMNDLAALGDAIRDMREARDSHERWAQHLAAGGCERCTPEVLATAGDADRQRDWVAKYDRVLSILHARRNALRSARRRGEGEDGRLRDALRQIERIALAAEGVNADDALERIANLATAARLAEAADSHSGTPSE